MAGELTKAQILSAAEGLFAKNGYAATSLRELTSAAGVNLAAVNYHFGTKEGLLRAVLDRVMGPLNAERIELLDEAEARSAPDPVPLDQVLAAFLLPDLCTLDRLRRKDPALPRFVSRMYTEGSELMVEIMGAQFAETQRRFSTALAAALPHLELTEIGRRMHYVVGIIVYLFAGVEVPGMPLLSDPDPDTTLARLLDFLLPAMAAPSST